MIDMNFSEKPGTTISQTAYKQLLDYCTGILPYEACGLLARTENCNYIDTVIPIANAHPSPANSFSFDPGDWTDAYYSMQKSRQQLVGFFHSHPHSGSIPSTRDSQGFPLQSGFQYWIVSFPEPSEPLVKPYYHDGELFMPISLMFA